MTSTPDPVDPPPPARPETPGSALARRRKALSIAAAVLALPLLWAAAQLAMRRPEPAPRFTEADLPAAPPPVDNGLVELDAAWTTAGRPSVPGALLDLLKPQPGKPLAERARARSAELTALLDATSSKTVLSAFERAIDMPRFADPCPVSIEQHCPPLAPLQSTRLALLSAAKQAGDGALPSAIGLAAGAARAGVDAASSSRMLVSYLVSLTSLAESLSMTRTLLEGYLASGGPPLDEATRQRLTRLDDTLSKLTPAQLGPRRAIIAERILAGRAVAYLQAGAPASSRALSFLLFDPGETASMLDQRTEALLAADSAGTPPPDFTPARDGSLWWLHNPQGKSVLDATAVDWKPRLATIGAEIAQISSLSAEVRSLIKKALAPAG